MPRNLKYLFLLLFLLFDTAYTFYQHYTKPIDGDLVNIVLFANHYEGLQGDPFGWQVMSEGKIYGGVNRFFVHQYLSTYFKNVPLFLQNFMSPIQSIYFASALSKTLVHLFLIGLLAWLASGSRRFRSKDVLISMAVIAPLFQTAGEFFRHFGVVDQSITYSSFYAMPFVLFLWFIKPYHDYLMGYGYALSNIQKITLLFALIILPFSGPLIPGVVMVMACLVGICGIRSLIKTGKLTFFEKLPSILKFYFVLLSALCLYSIFIGRYNLESQVHSVNLLTRYSLLPQGVFYLLTQKLPYLLLTIFLGSVFFIFYKSNHFGKQLKQLLLWLALFAILYTLLLPLGGYREYRPYIVRRDTFLPVILVLIYLYAYLSKQIIDQAQFKFRSHFFVLLFACSTIFMISDKPQTSGYTCQVAALEELSKSNKETVKLSDDCPVMSWEPIRKAEHSQMQAELFYYWNITKNEVLYYQDKEY